jgi:hypothetical protein
MLNFTARAQFNYCGTSVRPEIDLLFGGIGPLDWKRTNLALEAVKRGSDYLLWIDSDQTFPNDALGQLLVRDRPIVGTSYPSRHTGNPTVFDLNGNPLPRRSGLEEVGALGLGFCLMKAPIFERVPKPWFATEIGDDGELICGEDVHFCNQARIAGVPVFVDHDLTIGHIAERILTLEREDANADTVLPTAGAQ